MIQERDCRALRLLSRHLVLSSSAIQRRCYPKDATKRVTRRRLLKLLKAGYVKRRTLQTNGVPGGPQFLYQLDKKANEFLASKYGLDKYIYKPTSLRQPMHLRHYAELAEISLAFEDAIRTQHDVGLRAWFNEEEIVNWSEADSNKHRKLFTVVKNRPRIVCAPDAGFLIEYEGKTRICYVELERGTSGARHVAKKKANGFDLLQKRQLHKQHFPEVDDDCFDVLCVAQNRVHRDQLKNAFKDSPGKQLWLFVDKNQLTPDAFFFKPIWHNVFASEPVALINTQNSKSNKSSDDTTVVLSE